MRLLFLALSLSSSVVLAQTTANPVQLSIATQVGDTLTLGGPNVSCDDRRIIAWDLTGSGTAQACDEMPIWITTSSSCADAPGTGDFTVGTVTVSALNSGARTGTVDFIVSQMPNLGGADGGGACPQGTEIDYRVCASVKLLTGTFGVTCSNVTTFTKGNTLKIVYDTQAPDAPTVKEVVGLDSTLSISVESNGGEPNEFRVEVRNAADDSVVTSRTQGTQTPDFRIGGLQNGTKYKVVAFSRDTATNESAASEPVEGTPVKTNGFYQNYVNAGGQETGGCDVAGGGLAGGAVLAALGFWLSSRRNRS